MPSSSEKVDRWLGLKDCWTSQFVWAGYSILDTNILFERIDKIRLEEEVNKLG